MTGRPILLLGASGQVGSALRRAIGQRWTVVAPSRAELDLADAAAPGRTVADIAPGLIVNCAALTDVDAAERDPDAAMAVNGSAPGALAAAAMRLGVPLLHYSTDYVFGGDAPAPHGGWREEDVPAPVNRYGVSKLAGEKAVAGSGAAYLIFRLSWVYGPTGRNLLTTIRSLAERGGELHMVDDQVGSPTSADAIARATVAVIARRWRDGRADLDGVGGLYHLAAPGAVSRYNFARAVIAALGTRTRLLPANASEFPAEAWRPMFSALDSRKAREWLGVSLPGWRTQLRDCLAGSV